MLLVGIFSVIGYTDRKDSASAWTLLTELTLKIERVISFLDLADRGIGGTVNL